MSYADPQTVTVATVASTLPRTSSGTNSGVFTTGDGTTKLTVSHQYGNRNRRTIRLDFSKIAPNPLVSTQNVGRSGSVYAVADFPTDGFTNTEIADRLVALADYIKSGTGATSVVNKFVGGEN